MSPRHPSQQGSASKRTAAQAGPSPDRRRHLEDSRHHPEEKPLPHRKHRTLQKPSLPLRHTPHSHPHGDELPAHTNPPGPIKPSKKVTRTGAKK